MNLLTRFMEFIRPRRSMDEEVLRLADDLNEAKRERREGEKRLRKASDEMVRIAEESIGLVREHDDV